MRHAQMIPNHKWRKGARVFHWLTKREGTVTDIARQSVHVLWDGDKDPTKGVQAYRLKPCKPAGAP